MTGATHVHSYILYLIITRKINSPILENPLIVNPCLYDTKRNHSRDHLAIHVTLNCCKQTCTQRITFRRQSAISLPDFIKDVQLSTTLQYPGSNINDLVEAYNPGIKVLRKMPTSRSNVPQYKEESLNAKEQP